MLEIQKYIDNINDIPNILLSNDILEGSQIPFYKKNSDQELIYYKDYFYKMYVHDRVIGFFKSKVRKILGEIYESYGMTYTVENMYNPTHIITVEKKQRIPVYGIDTQRDLNNIFVEVNKDLAKIEKILDFNNIICTLNNNGYKVSKLKLMTDGLPKPIDFGEFNGHVILLDDENFSILAFDENGNLMKFAPFTLHLSSDLYIGTQNLYNSTDVVPTSYLTLYDAVGNKKMTDDILLAKDIDLKSMIERINVNNETPLQYISTEYTNEHWWMPNNLLEIKDE